MIETSFKDHKVKFVSTELFIAMVAVSIVVISAIFHDGLIHKQKWVEFPGYQNDSLSVLAGMKAAQSGDYKIFRSFQISSLGAPYIANWDDFPAMDPLLLLFEGFLTSCFGLALGANILILFGHIITTVSMYVSLRYVACSRSWSCIFAIVFGLAPFLFIRGFDHIVLTYAHSVPIICALAFLFVSDKLIFANRWRFFILCVISIYLGTIFIYYTVVYIQVLFAAIIYDFVNRKNLFSIWFYLLLTALVFTGFILDVSQSLIYCFQYGKNYFAINRAYGNLQVDALRPIELFLPGSGSHVPILKELSTFYENQDIFRNHFKYSESMDAYLGLVGCVAFIVLMAITCYYVITKQQQQISGWFWFVLWFLTFSVVGGINEILGLAKIYFFRASNRMSIFILAACLFFLAQLLTKKSRQWPHFTTVIISLLIITLTLYETFPQPLLPLEGKNKITRLVESDQKLVQQLESIMPKGAMIFDYPVIDFPESGTYAFLRPYLWSHNLHFSFGSIKGRSRELWQKDIAELPPDEIFNKLQQYGFSGVLIYSGEDLSPEDKKKAELLLGFIKSKQMPLISSELGDFNFVSIQPDAHPCLPVSRPLFLENWWDKSIQPIESNLPDNIPENQIPIWASQQFAEIEIYNEEQNVRNFVFSGEIYSLTDCDMKIDIKDKILWESSLGKNKWTYFKTSPISLQEGALRLKFSSNKASIMQQNRKFNFGLKIFTVERMQQ